MSLIGTVTLVAALTLVAAPAWAAQSHLAGARNSGPLAGSIAAQGHLVRPAGKPVAGARIILYAWPVQNVEAKLRPGQQVPLRTVGTARTTATGGYVVHVASPSALRASAARDGTVNLELITSTRAGWAAFSFSRRLVQTGQARRSRPPPTPTPRVSRLPRQLTLA